MTLPAYATEAIAESQARYESRRSGRPHGVARVGGQWAVVELRSVSLPSCVMCGEEATGGNGVCLEHALRGSME